MLLRKIDWIWKNGLIGTNRSGTRLYVFWLLILFGITGCSDKSEAVPDSITADSEAQSLEESVQTEEGENVQIEEEDIPDIFCEIYGEAAAENTGYLLFEGH